MEDESQSEDEECFLLRPKNLRNKKLALMRKCQAESTAADSPLSQQTPCTSQDVYYKKPDTPVAVKDDQDNPTAAISSDVLEEEIIPATPQRKKRFKSRKK